MPQPPIERGDLSVTALYTAGCWAWAGFPGARLYAADDTRGVFAVVNAVLWVASWFTTGTSALWHDLVHRHAALDRVVAEARPAVVLELAAGLSPRGTAYTSEHADVRWVEVDLPHMVAEKAARLQAHPDGPEVLARPGLTRVGADVTQVDLADIVTPEAPAVVLAEGLVVYLGPTARPALFRTVSDWLAPTGGTFAFDLVPPGDTAPGWLARALGWLMRRFTGGQDFDRTTFTVDEVEAELRDAGFTDVQAVVPSEVAVAWDLPFPDVRSRQLVWVAKR